MGLNPPVPQQDINWEIRVAVLLSLLLQVLLIFLGPTRKRSSHPIRRFTVWSCYLLADWVADLGLGLILNNMGNIGGNSTDSSSPIIFAFWTPFLLLHLGGPDTITAYSLEDNELWTRHLIGLLFELFSACVIFFCSLRGNPLIHATVLMFIVGIIKYGERTYSLYSASVERLRDSMVGPPVPGLDYAKLMGDLDARKKAGEDVEIAINQAGEERPERTPNSRESDEMESMSLEVRAYKLFLIFRRIFVDVVISLEQRTKSRDFFVGRRPKQALEVVDVELGFMYEVLYTKAPIAHTWHGLVLRSICSCCLVSALVIFFLLDKPRHQVKRADVGITYALLLGGLALDAAALIMLLFSNRAIIFLEQLQSSAKCKRLLAWFARLSRAVRQHPTYSSSWSGAASQMNLISYCGGGTTTNKNWRRWLMIAAKMLYMEEISMVHDLVFIKHVKLSSSNKEEDPYGSTLIEFIFDGLKHTAHKVGDDKKSINEVCNRRGAGVLQDLCKERINARDNKRKVIMESVENRGLDESLLLWHIATDLCLLGDKSPPGAGAGGTQVEDLRRMRAISKILSEYMLYLLIKQPDMLSATTGIGLRPYRDTCAEARRFLASTSTSDSNEDARQALLRVNTSEKPRTVKGDRSKSVLFDGVILAKVLRELDEGFMWRLVSGLWLEMLMFSAVSSRGSTHVRSLNRGGELVTIVWLIMHHMGLSDMYEIQQQDPTPQFRPRSLPQRSPMTLWRSWRPPPPPPGLPRPPPQVTYGAAAAAADAADVVTNNY